jgi:hypothetical protein
MAGTTTPNYLQAPPRSFGIEVTAGDGANNRALVSSGTNGTKVESILVTNSDSTNRDIVMKVSISGSVITVGTIAVSAGSGTTNVAPTVNVLYNSQIPGVSRDNNGNPFFYLGTNANLLFATTTTVSAGKSVGILAYGADF